MEKINFVKVDPGYTPEKKVTVSLGISWFFVWWVFVIFLFGCKFTEVQICPKKG